MYATRMLEAPSHEVHITQDDGDGDGDGDGESSDAAAANAADETLFNRVRDFFYSEDITTMLETYATQNARRVALGEEEHRLEYSEMHREFLSLFEDAITNFIEKECNSSIHDFYAEVQMLQSKAGNAKGKSGSSDVFIDTLNLTADYEIFIEMMQETHRDILEEEESSQREKEGKCEESELREHHK